MRLCLCENSLGGPTASALDHKSSANMESPLGHECRFGPTSDASASSPDNRRLGECLLLSRWAQQATFEEASD
jgi:hypothetical protein